MQLPAVFRIRNGWLCVTYELFFGMFFGTAIMAVYYKAYGLSQFKINVLQSVIAVTAIVADIPGGYLADRLGNKRAMVIGSGGLTVGYTLFALCTTFWQFAMTVAVTGTSSCIVTGNTSSLMRAELGNEHVQTFEFWSVQAGTLGRVASIVLGDVMIRHGGVQLPYVFQPLVFASCLLAALGLKSHRTAASEERQKQALPVMRRVAREMLVSQPTIRRQILLFATVNSICFSLFWLLQSEMREAGIKLTHFSECYVAMFLSVIPVAWLGKVMFRRSSRNVRLVVLLGAMCACPLLGAILGGLYAVAFSALGVVLSFSLTTPLLRMELRRYLPETSSTHTTELSVASAALTLMFAVVSPLVGMICDLVSVTVALFAIAAMGTLIGGWQIVGLQRSE